MRVAAVIESPISVGGGFSQALNAVLQLKALAAGRHDVVAFTTVPDDRGQLEALGIQTEVLRLGWVDRMVRPYLFHPYFDKLQDLTGFGCSVERQLLERGVDLAYFTAPSPLPMYLRRVGYITTVWDVCHLDQPEFPEVGTRGEFARREFIFFNTLPRAIAVICASESMKGLLMRHYGLDPSRLLAMPFAPSPFLHVQGGPADDDVLRKYGLTAGYYYYPAQFWPHKNHVRIVQALERLGDQQPRRLAVFSGKDHGNLDHIRKTAERLGVADRIRVLGFVPPEDVRGLYKGCFALVMPTYFGPTNIPPLEAWSLDRPVVYSSHLHEQVADAALLVDPDSAEELAAALRRLEDADVRRSLSENGARRLRQTEAERMAAGEDLARRLLTFSRRVECGRPS